MAAILKTKMAAKNWTHQLASIKISVQEDLNYLCDKIHNFIQKCTLHLIYCLKSPHYPENSLFEEYLCQISSFYVNFKVVFSYKSHYYMCLYVVWIEIYA